MFVRLVSHEIRTPLNVVMTGLKLIERDLAMQENDLNKGILDTLCDVKLSCDAAVDLLNDLLAYEKLDAGIMTLETTTMDVVCFVKKAIQPFYIQVIVHLLACYTIVINR